ncbi:MAG: LGFP repeat-containing protein [Caulobacteraceae bacterium]
MAATIAPIGAAPTMVLAQASDDAPACGQGLGGPILAKWMAMGGARGPFGCPVAGEAVTATSPQGSRAREATFAAGTILWHASGPHAGQTYAVSGCLYRLYFQYGGPSGWLGLPVSEVENVPDGQRQAFEGGVMRFQRASGQCEADHSAEAIAAAAPAARAGLETSPLDQFYDASRGDYFAAASAASAARAQAAHYRRLRTEGYVFTQPLPGAIPLKAYWNEALGAHETVATAEGERDALAAGYVFDGSQGFIYADPKPGTAPLKLYRSAARGHELVTATAEGGADAVAQGYAFVRIEGYVPTGPD